jgi:hypothetical protein
MASPKTLNPGAIQTPHTLRPLIATCLRSASAALARLARYVYRPAAVPARPTPRLEFYAEAGAPEGALYLDGQLIGWIEGVRRL